MDAPAALARLVARTTEAVARCVGEDGVLRDAGADAPTPPDHYGATFAALALAVADPGDDRWRALVRAWTAQPDAARGHAPFNRLALLVLGDHLRRVERWRPDDERLLGAALARCPVAFRYPSNNWVLLARACEVLAAAADGRSAHAESAAARFEAACRAWVTPQGGFIDFPPAPPDGRGATPLAYHAKLVALLVLVCRAAPSPERWRLLEQTLEWLAAWVDETGLTGGFGRSNHALFGASCALFALEHARADDAEHASADDAEHAGGPAAGALGDTAAAGPDAAALVERMCARLEQSRRDDGLLALTPSGRLGAAGGWDRYMHLSVYNAHAAGLLGWAVALRAAPQQPPLVAPPGRAGSLGAAVRAGASAPARAGGFCDERAGLVARRGAAARLHVSTSGQPVQDLAVDEADLRTAALLPWHLVRGGRPVVAPPLRVRCADLVARPALAGWTPVFEAAGALWGLTRADAVAVHADGARLVVWGRGEPARLHHVAAARGSLAWWLENVDHHLAGGRRRRRRGLHPPRLAGHLVRAAVVLDADAGWWAHVVVLDGRRSDAVHMNPHGRALLRDAAPPDVTCARFGAAEALSAAAIGAEQAAPGPLPGAVVACGARWRWPERDAALVTACGAGAEVPVTVDLAAGELVLPWARLPLEPPR